MHVRLPNSAAIHRLRLLADHGALLHYHGAFDGKGSASSPTYATRRRLAPWRMGRGGLPRNVNYSQIVVGPTTQV
ncbi:DUF2399 domain-containing protein [Streptomyces sioyaensis]|uniref:DUF2399 domain-containing protein n=1 Tax=Streptomyces sioyaensis TaxID=67364 RepID=UPI0037A54D72